MPRAGPRRWTRSCPVPARTHAGRSPRGCRALEPPTAAWHRQGCPAVCRILARLVSDYTEALQVLLVEELKGVLEEPLGILELRSMPGVGVDQQLSVGDVLGEVP